jgi:hypothetical protein
MKKIKSFDVFVNEAEATTTPYVPKMEDFKDTKALEIFNKLAADLKQSTFEVVSWTSPEGKFREYKITKGNPDSNGASVTFNPRSKEFRVNIRVNGKSKINTEIGAGGTQEGKSFQITNTTADEILKALNSYKKMDFK